MRLKYTIAILILLLLVGCTKKPTTTIDLNQIKICNSILTTNVKEDEFRKLLYLQTEEEANKQVYQFSDITYKPDRITSSEATKDVIYLFEILKQGYPAYQFFGGKSVFEKAKDTMLMALKQQKTLTQKEFKKILVENMQFVQDAHFAIEEDTLVKPYVYINYEEWEIYDDDQGYYFIKDKKKYYLESINKDSPDQYLRPSISSEGTLIYKIGIVVPYTQTLQLPIELRIDNEKISRIIQCKFVQPTIPKTGKLEPTMSVQNNIPIIQIPSFECELPDQWIEETKVALEKSKTLVIDLRGNRGGNFNELEKWLWQIGGRGAWDTMFSAQLDTDTSCKIATNNNQDKIEKFKVHHTGWNHILQSTRNNLKADYKVYLLVDKNTASTSEICISAFKNTYDTTVIGTNTWGALLTGNTKQWYLPNSKIRITSGVLLSLFSDLQNRDGIGIMPDLWLNENQTIEDVIKFIMNYH